MTRTNDRHIPRVCRACQAPLGGNDAVCARCGARWVADAPDEVPAPAQAEKRGRP